MEHIQRFEQFIVDAAEQASDLTKYLSQEVDIFTQYIRKRAWEKNIRILDADGKSALLAIGLSLQGYDVYTINQETITIPDSLEFTMRRSIKPYQWHQQEKFKLVILPHDAISENLTENALQQTLGRLFDVLENNGSIVITTRFYGRMLDQKPEDGYPYHIDVANKRYIQFAVRNWLCKADYTYQQDQFVIQQTGESYKIHNNRSHHRAWRRAELNMSLSQAGFKGIQYHSLKKGRTFVTATKS